MKSKGYITLDEIAITNAGYKVNPPNKNKWKTIYTQPMQSLYGSRKFLLITCVSSFGANMISIILKEDRGEWTIVAGKRHVNNNEQDISKAIKSLERKAGCKLYYVLLISTDGDYL